MIPVPPDFHSHSPHSVIRSLDVAEYRALTACGGLLTVGIHPWNTASASVADIAVLRAAVRDPRVVAVGEIGIDPLRGASVECQAGLVVQQLEIARDADLPVVFHIVRRYDLLMQLYNRFAPLSRPWAVHGFRGKPAVARDLAARGIYMSVGERFNPGSVRAIPRDLLLVESDDSQISVAEIAGRVAEVRGEGVETVVAAVTDNFKHFFGDRF